MALLIYMTPMEPFNLGGASLAMLHCPHGETIQCHLFVLDLTASQSDRPVGDYNKDCDYIKVVQWDCRSPGPGPPWRSVRDSFQDPNRLWWKISDCMNDSRSKKIGKITYSNVHGIISMALNNIWRDFFCLAIKSTASNPFVITAGHGWLPRNVQYYKPG